jgi:hypothetical protein
MATAKTQPKVQFNTRMDPAVYKALCAHSTTDGVSKTEIVDAALRAFLQLAARKGK